MTPFVIGEYILEGKERKKMKPDGHLTKAVSQPVLQGTSGTAMSSREVLRLHLQENAFSKSGNQSLIYVLNVFFFSDFFAKAKFVNKLLLARQMIKRIFSTCVESILGGLIA